MGAESKELPYAALAVQASSGPSTTRPSLSWRTKLCGASLRMTGIKKYHCSGTLFSGTPSSIDAAETRNPPALWQEGRAEEQQGPRREMGYTAFCRFFSTWNCSVSVEPSRATVDAWPLAIVCVISSK